MPSFKELTNSNVYDKWTDSTKFKSKNLLVDENGKYVNTTYAGRKYRLVSKKERHFSFIKRVWRIFLGTLVVTCSLGFALYSKHVRDLFTKKIEKVRLGFSVSTKIPKVAQNPIKKPFFDHKKLPSTNFSDFESTGKTVKGIGSGECGIYRLKDGSEYIMKKNNVIEFYAGTLFQFLLGERSSKVIFVNDDSNFYAGVLIEPSFQNTHLHFNKNNNILTQDLQGLAHIIVASFILGEKDLKGLIGKDTNLGVITVIEGDRYFKIDHGSAFCFGGEEDWKKLYAIDQNWKVKLRQYTNNLWLNMVPDEYLEDAINRILSVPLKTIEEICDFCEKQLENYPTILEKETLSLRETLFYGLPKAKTIKEAVVARFQLLHKYANTSQTIPNSGGVVESIKVENKKENKFIQAANGLNQRKLGFPNGCTHFSCAFVANHPKVIDGESLVQLLSKDYGVVQGVNGDALEVIPTFNNLQLVNLDGEATQEETIVIVQNQSSENLQDCLQTLFSSPKQFNGCVITNGIETFSMVINDNEVQFFDPHGNAEQTDPAFVRVYDNQNSVKEISQFMMERSAHVLDQTGQLSLYPLKIAL